MEKKTTRRGLGMWMSVQDPYDLGGPFNRRSDRDQRATNPCELRVPSVLAALLVFAFIASACNRVGPVASFTAPPISTTSALTPGDHGGSLIFEGRERSYIIHLPPAIGSARAFPLVIVLHGGGGSADGTMKQTGMSAKADQENFIVVYPNGTGRNEDRLLTWNSGNCCGYALDNRVDDVGFMRVLIPQIEGDYPERIDVKKIYATGISNGGMMAYRLACELSDQIAAIAPVSGALNNECKPASSVSVIAFHGTADENVPYNGGAGTKSIDPHPRTDQSVAYAMNFWSGRDGCSPKPQRIENGNVARVEYSGCLGNTSVVLYTLVGGGHAWPGGQRMAFFLDPPFKEISATDLMWEFFVAHPKP